jgi:hypothetical protein
VLAWDRLSLISLPILGRQKSWCQVGLASQVPAETNSTGQSRRTIFPHVQLVLFAVLPCHGGLHVGYAWSDDPTQSFKNVAITWFQCFSVKIEATVLSISSSKNPRFTINLWCGAEWFATGKIEKLKCSDPCCRKEP